MTKIINVGVGKYNSYLITDEKKILIDTVPREHFFELKKNIERLVPLSEIDYVVFTRTDPEASGCLFDILSITPDIMVVASAASLKNLKEITNCSFCEVLAKDERTLNIGGYNLQFLITPNLSWPDTICVYLSEERTAFSGNLFCSNRYTDSFLPLYAVKAAERIGALDIKTVLPGYGEGISASEIPKYAASYDRKEAEKKAAVVFASDNGATEKMAQAVKDAFFQCGITAQLLDADKMLPEEILSEIDSCCYLAFGTPTINHNASKTVFDIAVGMNVSVNERNPALIFGSYGWSGEGVHILHTLLRSLKVNVYKKPYLSVFFPSEEKLDGLRCFVREFLEDSENA